MGKDIAADGPDKEFSQSSFFCCLPSLLCMCQGASCGLHQLHSLAFQPRHPKDPKGSLLSAGPFFLVRGPSGHSWFRRTRFALALFSPFGMSLGEQASTNSLRCFVVESQDVSGWHCERYLSGKVWPRCDHVQHAGAGLGAQNSADLGFCHSCVHR